MKVKGDPEKHGPQHKRPTADCQQPDAEKDDRHPIIVISQHVKSVFHHVRRITLHSFPAVRFRGAYYHPSDVRPPAAVTRRMRIARPIRVRVMYAMRHHPVNGAALQREQATDSDEILHQLWRFVAAMS